MTLRAWWRRHRWAVIAAMAVTSLGLALWGLSQLPAAVRPPVPDRIYDSIDLFHLGSSLPAPPYPAALEVARWLAPLTLVLAGLAAIGALFGEQLTRLRVRLTFRDHLVVCGLGTVGYHSALAFRRKGYRVAIIDRAPVEDRAAACREVGIPVLKGEATDPAVLRDAALGRARYLLAVCGDDSLNADVATVSIGLWNSQPRRGSRPGCFVHVDDDELSRLLEDGALEGGGDSVVTAFVNLHRAAPVVLLNELPDALLGEGNLAPHVVLVGGDRVVADVADLVVRTWWAAARSTQGAPPSRARPRLTLVDPGAADRAKELTARHPTVTTTCELVAVTTDLGSTELAEPSLNTAGCAPPSVFVCAADDATGIRMALRLRQQVPPRSRIVVRTSGAFGASSLLDVVPAAGGVDLIAVPLLDRVCQPETILNTRVELIARALHDNYVENRRRDGTIAPDRVGSHRPWDQLEETYRDANRAQASRVVERLGVVGYAVRSTDDWDPPLPSFSADEVETMARWEHELWCDDRRRNGWRFGSERDEWTKVHPDLVSWEELAEPRRELDREPVRELPALLARHGFAVERVRQ